MTNVPPYVIPGLGVVTIDTVSPSTPVVEIRLAPEYRGDLNDIAKQTPGPDDVYLRCNDTSAIDNPDLAKFMEVAKHWDHDGDDVPDCDEIMQAIDDALWRSDDHPKVFHRPQSGWYTRAVMKLVPPAPERHIVFSFGELRPRFRWYQHLAAIPMIGLFIGSVLLQNEYLPFMKYSVVSGLQAFYESFGLKSWLVMALVVITIIVGMRISGRGKIDGPSAQSKHTYGFFNKAAIFEEQAFREGSESWSTFGRFRSCVAFGAIHMVNLIYPLASILPLAIGGALLTFIYLRTYRRTNFRRTAVLEAAVWHRVYNRVALIAIVISLSAMIGIEIFLHFAVLGVLVGLGLAWQRFYFRREIFQPAPQLEPVATH